jgi:hypothetical protein
VKLQALTVRPVVVLLEGIHQIVNVPMVITVIQLMDNAHNADLIVYVLYTSHVRPVYTRMLILDKFLTVTVLLDIMKIRKQIVNNVRCNVKVVRLILIIVQNVRMDQTEQWNFLLVVAMKDIMLKMTLSIVVNVYLNAKHAITRMNA